MYEASRATWKNRHKLPGFIETPSDFFGGVRSVMASKFPDAVVGLNFDGVGTKIEIAERMANHGTIAHDLLAMVCDDAAIRGAEPILFGSILDFNRVSLKVVSQLAQGMVTAATSAGVSVINGEIAELGNRVHGFGPSSYNWGGAVFWIARKDRILSGSLLEPGQSIIALKEDGFRSNGLTLARRIFTRAFGHQWHRHRFKNRLLGSYVLEPSIIYSRLLVNLSGGYSQPTSGSMTGAVHITGGGIPGKLGRLLHGTPYGATLDNLFPPPDIMLLAQAEGNVSDEECYRAWNMGQGLLIVTATPDDVLRRAEGMGFDAQIAGTIEKTEGITILSQGLKSAGKSLFFDQNG